MDKRDFDEFDLFVSDLGSETGKPRSLEEIIRERGKILTPGELLEVSNREREQRAEVDPFTRLLEAEQAVAQARIEQAIKGPSQFKKSAAEPAFTTEAKAEPGDLSWALGESEPGDSPLPTIRGTFPNSGRVREPERSFAKSHGSTRGSFLNQPFDKILEAVGERASTPGARSLAKTLAQEAREYGGGL
jgi:hypothetical protein